MVAIIMRVSDLYFSDIIIDMLVFDKQIQCI